MWIYLLNALVLSKIYKLCAMLNFPLTVHMNIFFIKVAISTTLYIRSHVNGIIDKNGSNIKRWMILVGQGVLWFYFYCILHFGNIQMLTIYSMILIIFVGLFILKICKLALITKMYKNWYNLTGKTPDRVWAIHIPLSFKHFDIKSMNVLGCFLTIISIFILHFGYVQMLTIYVHKVWF